MVTFWRARTTRTRRGSLLGDAEIPCSGAQRQSEYLRVFAYAFGGICRAYRSGTHRPTANIYEQIALPNLQRLCAVAVQEDEKAPRALWFNSLETCDALDSLTD